MNKTINKMSKTKTQNKMVSKYLTDEMLNDLKMSYHNEDGKIKKCKFVLVGPRHKTEERFMTNSIGDWLEFTLRIDKYGSLCIECSNEWVGFSKTKLNYEEGHNWLSPGMFEILKSQIQQMTNYFDSSVYPNWK